MLRGGLLRTESHWPAGAPDHERPVFHPGQRRKKALERGRVRRLDLVDVFAEAALRSYRHARAAAGGLAVGEFDGADGYTAF